MSRYKGMALIAILILTIVVLAACATAAPAEPQVVVQTVVVEKEKLVESTVVVEKEVQVEVTATPAPVSFGAPRPDTYTGVVFGDVDTLDPNLAYDTASGTVIMNVMEPLIFYNGPDATSYVPVLAMEVPSVENGGISADGLTYTFNIRQGVKFHQGGDLTPSDVAYTFQRGLLQSDPNGPQWLLLEPLLGYTSGDVTEEIAEGAYAGDPEALKANATPEDLQMVCDKVMASVVADDAAGTVTMNLAQPWGPMLATLAQTWGAVLDKEWAIENGAWDGTCETWIDHYAPGAENDELSEIINGTGPYMLESWTPGEGWVLTAFDGYWRGDDMPVWEGGPAGAPRIKRIVEQQVNEWGTRFAMLQAGDAESVDVPVANRPQVDEFVGEFCDYQTGACTPSETNPDGPLRKWANLPSVSRTDVFLNFNVETDENGQNPYIGSGQLDGNGIPRDFFNDIHVRKAMGYCFDYDAFIADALNGEGARNNGPIILDMLGYNPDGPMYEFDLDQCASELEQAWGGVLPETGFRFQIAFNTGNTTRQTVAAIYQNNLASINEKYQVEIIGLPWPTLLRSFRAKQLPVAVSGWLEDIHDPHNWVQPYAVGTYAGRQNMPEDLLNQFQELVNAGVAASDPAERQQIYYDLQQLYYDQIPTVILAQAAGSRYEQRWVDGFFYNPVIHGIANQVEYSYMLGLTP
ncbi:MAG: ABC transporter substrate-binding protein [Caldilineales bacterium]|nr:ABC transporter substrate-binding protein [Caldilineales bacterium]